MTWLRRVLNLRLPWLIAAALTAAPAAAQDQPSAEPMLRVETGMHTAMINRAATDAAGRILATASDDKTVRLWSLQTGELIRALRPPIGTGNEGKLYAVAMSPDGRLVLTAGWTGYEWENTHSIYVFEAASGHLVHRVGGLPRVILHLAWSSDGNFVVATLGDAKGIRVYRTSDWQEVARDTEYRDATYGASFDRSGRLAAVADDGYLRLYDREFRRIKKVKTPGGARPFSVAFSPDGTKLAVGYDDTTNVTVFPVPDLRRVFSADTSGLSRGNLSAVAWTADRTLLAGRGLHASSDFPVFRWPEGGRGHRQELAAADNTVMSIVPLADGGFAYASFDPAFGVYDRQLQRRIDHRAEIIDFRDQLKALRLSGDGTRVAFGLQYGGRSPVWFGMTDRQLGQGAAAESLDTADTTSLPIADWEDEFTPKLAGKTLELEKYERSRSLAIAPDRQSFVLGTEWNLRRFDGDGEAGWSIPIPAVAWAVNISRDGRLAVAGLGDGTIRWYRYQDGKELLALFVDRGAKRWVLWTPEGYYDASPGGEDLIGWHVNRDLDHAADFFPASRFRERFYRPAAVSTVLRTLDIEKALNETASRAAPSTPLTLPPVVTILSPQEGDAVNGSTVEVHYVVRSPSGERVTSVQVLVDGRPLEGQRGVPMVLQDGPATPEAERDESVVVPIDHDETISLFARAGERAGEAAAVKVLWKGERPFTAPQGRLYLLAVGVSDYADEKLKLHYAAKDAADVAAAFKGQEGGLYREVVARLLSDKDATRTNIFDGLQWLEEKTKKHDVAMVFLSGHGTTDSSGEYYFLAEDSDPGKLELTAVPNSWFAKTLSHVAGKTLFFFDTCRSGSVSPPDINLVANKLSSDENGLVVFAASTGREFAYEREEWGNGAFTKALIEALTGKADASTYRNGRTTVDLLDAWLEEEVKSITKDLQHPVALKPHAVRDFAVAEQRS